MKKEKKILLLTIGLLLIILMLLISIVKQEKKNSEKDLEIKDNTTYYEDTRVDKLSGMTEKERIRFYFSKYIELIENGDFETAYNILYPEFKNRYFNSLQKFEDYIKTKYPDIISVQYISLKREGVYYIISVKIEDVVHNKSFDQKFVIREYGFNDFVLSFQVL